VILAVAVVACAWFAIGARQSHEVSAATELLNNASTERVAVVQRRAQSMLDAAAFLYPGTDVTLLRAQLAENERDYLHAKRLLGQAAAAEPDNIAVWLAYLKLGLLDPSVSNRKVVFGRMHNLDPIDIHIPRSR
jgi:hypothetical protein